MQNSSYCRHADDSSAARATARTAESLAAMGVEPSANSFGAAPSRLTPPQQGLWPGPSHTAPQQQGFAAFAPVQGNLNPPPPFNRVIGRQPRAGTTANGVEDSSSHQSGAGPAYGRQPAAGNAAFRAGAAGQAMNAFDVPTNLLGSSQNGVTAHPAAKQTQRGQTHPQNQVNSVLPDWCQELWDKKPDRNTPGFDWVQQQNASSGQANGQLQHRRPTYEQMQSIPAQHAAPKQKPAPVPAASEASKSLDIGNIDDFVEAMMFHD